MKVISVKALPNYQLSVVFDDGIHGVIDLSEFDSKGIFSDLKNENSFSKVYYSGHSIAWSNELEIDELAIYAELSNKKPEQILKSAYSHVSN